MTGVENPHASQQRQNGGVARADDEEAECGDLGTGMGLRPGAIAKNKSASSSCIASNQIQDNELSMLLSPSNECKLHAIGGCCAQGCANNNNNNSIENIKRRIAHQNSTASGASDSVGVGVSEQEITQLELLRRSDGDAVCPVITVVKAPPSPVTPYGYDQSCNK